MIDENTKYPNCSVNVHLYGGIPFSRAARHHTIAGKLIAPEHTQTAAIRAAARFRVIRIGYWIEGELFNEYFYLFVIRLSSNIFV